MCVLYQFFLILYSCFKLSIKLLIYSLSLFLCVWGGLFDVKLYFIKIGSYKKFHNTLNGYSLNYFIQVMVKEFQSYFPQDIFPVVTVIGEFSLDYKTFLSTLILCTWHSHKGFSFQKKQLFPESSVVCASLFQVHFILAVFDQKSPRFQNASSKLLLTVTVVFLVLLSSSPSFEATTYCAWEVRYFSLPAPFGPLSFGLLAQLMECHIYHPEEYQYSLVPFPTVRGKTGLSSEIRWDTLSSREWSPGQGSESRVQLPYSWVGIWKTPLLLGKGILGEQSTFGSNLIRMRLISKMCTTKINSVIV